LGKAASQPLAGIVSQPLAGYYCINSQRLISPTKGWKIGPVEGWRAAFPKQTKQSGVTKK